MADESKVVILNNQIEAQLLESVLKEKNIPHVIRSYEDFALDGIYQLQQGWGHVETPPQYLKQVREIYHDLSKKST
ncbi:MAG: hypothetical protein JW822_00330 [Spirochaetales bacterium]|nr:hypothetical protein [Spirochaetales bacterium]